MGDWLESNSYQCDNYPMPKTMKDWVALLVGVATLVMLVSGRLVPPTWLEGIGAWRFVFCLFIFGLVCWAIDHYVERQIVMSIREATAALKKLEESTTRMLSTLDDTAKKLTTIVGHQNNTVVALDGKIGATYEYIRQSLETLLKRFPPPPKA